LSAIARSGDGSAVFKRLSYVWRLFWTGAAFAVLGTGGFILGLTLIPAATLFVADEQARNRRAQTIIRNGFRIYVTMLRVLGVLKLEVTGAAKLRNSKGKLIVANHPTLIDIVLIMALLPDAKCVVKSELFDSWLLCWVVGAAGYIRNDRDPEVLIEKCRDALSAGYNLVIFPEGTRSMPGQPLRFKRGFAHIATLTGANVQPLRISCAPITLIKGEPYFKIPDSRPSFRIEVADEIDPGQFLNLSFESRARGARRLASQLEADYSSYLKNA
jgi:1-acyl-sn-glycerol-3-phosphate acyltransferase